jgi:hypothetical protein
VCDVVVHRGVYHRPYSGIWCRGNRKNMGSEAEGGVLDIHFGNKTDVDICDISLVEKNTV